MKIEFLNQKGTLTFDIERKYPIVWTEDENGKHVDELHIEPVKGKIEVSCDVIVDTGDLKIADCMEFMRVIHEMDKKFDKCHMKEVHAHA